MRPELTMRNFTAKLEKNIDFRYHPELRDARNEEIKRALREIVGENAWENDLLNKRDVATLYNLIEGRKERIPVLEDREAHMSQHYLAEIIKKTGEDFGMRAGEFDRNFANMRTVNQMLADNNIGTYSRLGMERLVGKYEGNGREQQLITQEHIQPISPIVASQLERAPKQLKVKPKPRLAPKPAPAPKQSSPAAFEKRWAALESYCSGIEDMEANGITLFIADGPKAALNLDNEQFEQKLETARKALGWTDIDTPETQKLLNGLQADYNKFHEQRELAGRKRS